LKVLAGHSGGKYHEGLDAVHFGAWKLAAGKVILSIELGWACAGNIPQKPLRSLRSGFPPATQLEKVLGIPSSAFAGLGVGDTAVRGGTVGIA